VLGGLKNSVSVKFGVLLCVTGEPALEAPSYYFTKPAGTPAEPSTSTCQPPPDGAQRFSRRVRGISINDDAADKLKTDSAETSSAQPPYRMVTKRIRFRRSTPLPKSASPWCRSTRRVYRRVIVYVDEHGKELSALDIHKRTKTKAGRSQSAAETEKMEKSRLSPGSITRSKRLSTDQLTAGSSSVAEVGCSVKLYTVELFIFIVYSVT